MSNPPERITPLPWQYQWTDGWGGCFQVRGEYKFPREYQAEVCQSHGRYPVDEANAAYIVHACNTFPKLLAINAELVEALEDVISKAELRTWEVDQLNKLIQKAKGGA